MMMGQEVPLIAKISRSAAERHYYALASFLKAILSFSIVNVNILQYIMFTFWGNSTGDIR